MPVNIDKWGIVYLYETKSGEVSWTMNDNANNSDLTIHEVGSVTKKTEKGLTFFQADVKNGSLKSGGSRPTFRIDIRPTGEHNGSQKYGANNNPGYLNSPNDIGDAEFTCIYRFSNKTGEHNVGFKCRGGDHHDSSDDSADVGICYPTAPLSKGTNSTKNYTCFFEKELIHAQEDNIGRPALVATPGMPEGKWVACKGVTFVSGSKQVTNQLWCDFDPIDFTKSPPVIRNNYVKVAEYIDKGEDTGQYAKCVNWRGCTWSIRSDNVRTVDFFGVSLRSISSNYTGSTGVPGGGSSGSATGVPPPPVFDDGSGNTGSSGGTTGTGPKPPTSAAILKPPVTQNTVDNKGTMANPPLITLIYWGSYWNGTPTSGRPSRSQITQALSDIFDTKYFDSLYQYRGLKRPTLVTDVVNTTYAVKDQYLMSDIDGLIKNCLTTSLISTPSQGDELRNIYVVMSDPTHNNAYGVTSRHGQTSPGNYLCTYFNAQPDLDSTTEQLTLGIINEMTNNIPNTGITLKPEGKPTTALPVFPTPATNYVKFVPPQPPSPMNVYFIFAGSTWQSGSNATTKNTIMNNCTTLFNSYYFDGLIQYGYIKRPILKGSVINTTYSLPNSFDYHKVIDLVNDTIAKKQVPDNTNDYEFNSYYVIIPTGKTYTTSPNATGAHANISYADGHQNWYMFAMMDKVSSDVPIMQTISHEIAEMMLTPATSASSGYYIKDGTPLQSVINVYDNEICDACEDTLAHRKGVVNGVDVGKYWSDQDGACVAPSSKPSWISCPSGYTWDNTNQTCKISKDTGTDIVHDITYVCGDSRLSKGITNPTAATAAVSSDPVTAPITLTNWREIHLIANNVTIHFIYWGSYWKTATSPVSKAQIDTAMNDIFNSHYFEYLYQYKDQYGARIRNPKIGRSVINTTFATKNKYDYAVIWNLIQDSVKNGLVPNGIIKDTFPAQQNFYYIFPPPGIQASDPFGGGTFGFHGNTGDPKQISAGNYAGDTITWGITQPGLTTLDAYTFVITHELSEILSDPIPFGGVTLSAQSPLYSEGTADDPTEDEIADVGLFYCVNHSLPQNVVVNGHSCARYWSELDNAPLPLASATSAPTWVSCPTGSSYDSTNQICKGTGSGGSTSGGGTTPGGVSGYFVTQYWSDEDGKCIAPELAPTWISCPSGYKWDETKQECVSTGDTNTGGGSSGGGTGTGGGSGGGTGSGSGGGGSCGCDDGTKPPPVGGTGGTGGETDTSGGTTTPQQPPPPPIPGSGGTGGTPQQGSANTVDLGVAGAGGGAQPTGQSVITLSKSWKMLFNVGASVADHCTLGNPLEAKDYIPIFDVPIDQNENGYDDLGYSYGDGIIEACEYINTDKSSLYNQTIRKVTIKSIFRLLDADGSSCTGYMWCYIKNFVTNQIMANIGEVIDVSRIGVNEQTLDFIQDDNNYSMNVGDMIVIHYEDDSAGKGKALRIKRSTKDMIDSVNTFYAINAGSGYLGNADNDACITVYI